MKNDFVKFMREHNIDIEESTELDIIPNYFLNVIPEYNYHYRDENDHMHIAPKSNPHSVVLNTMIYKRSGKYWRPVEDFDFAHRMISTMEELREYLKELPTKIQARI